MAVVRTAKGTANSKAPTTSWTALTAIAIANGASIIVGVGSQTNAPSGVTWNGISLSEDKNDGGAAASKGKVYSLHNVTGATGDIIVSFGSAPGSAALWVIEVTGLAAAATDKSSAATGGVAGFSSGASATTTQADEFMVGSLMTTGPFPGDTAPTVSTGDTQTVGQRNGTTGGSATTNMTCAEFYGTQVATGARTFSGTQNGTARVYSAIIVTYKVAAVVYLPPAPVIVGFGARNRAATY